MDLRLLAVLGTLVVATSCTSIYEVGDFAALTEAAKAETAGKTEGEATGDAEGAKAEGDTAAATETAATDTEASETTKTETAKTEATTAAETAAAGATPTVTAQAVPPQAAPAQTTPATVTAEAAAAATATAPATAAPAGSSMVSALAPTAKKLGVPIDDDYVEAPPEDDEPEAAAFKAPRREKMESLPGVNWPEGIVLVSRTPNDDDPRGFFGGAVHPFSRSVAGIPRSAVVAANGLLLAHDQISVSCLKPSLLSIVRRAEQRFGKRVVITSGYRSPPHNRRVRGARNSQHMYCSAVDLYMPGVARDDLAKYLFAQPDRGGIGLYCHTQSIHIDVGSRRAWRWPCYQKRKKA